MVPSDNRDEDTYAEEDLFDHLDYIEGLRSNGLTNAEIADRFDWSESRVKDYSALLTNTVVGVLEIAKEYEEGRTTEKVGATTFTQYWFRTTNLYDLDRDGTIEYAKPDEDLPGQQFLGFHPDSIP